MHGHSRRRSSIAEGLGRNAFSIEQLVAVDDTTLRAEKLASLHPGTREWVVQAINKWLRNPFAPHISVLTGAAGTGKSVVAAMLMDPSARQCYDAWLDIQQNPTAEKSELTRARLLWYNGNDQAPNIKFGPKMFKSLVPVVKKTSRPVINTSTSKPLCRQCRCCFDFAESYLVLHCDCTTRVGHVACMEMFSDQVRGKCPVCRKALLQRHQVSKYLFWNVKEKFKFIS